MDIDVSVIVPIYNMASCIASGVAALKGQTCKKMQVILVNDGSTDDSELIAREAIQGLENFTLITTKNQGAGPARNTGIAKAEGRYLYFYDIDDRLNPDSIERMVTLADEAGCDLLVFAFTRTKDFNVPAETIEFSDASVSGDDMRRNYEKYMIGSTTVQGAPWNKLFRRDVVEKYAIEYPPLRRHQDEGFIMRYAAKVASVRFSSEVLYHYLNNDLSRRWKKYPIDYGDVVEALMDMYEQIVIAWNPKNDEVRRIIYHIYYQRNLDVLKVLFNPKWKLTIKKRYNMLVDRQKTFEARAKKYEGLQIFRDRYWNLIWGRHYKLLYMAIQYRVILSSIIGK